MVSIKLFVRFVRIIHYRKITVVVMISNLLHTGLDSLCVVSQYHHLRLGCECEWVKKPRTGTATNRPTDSTYFLGANFVSNHGFATWNRTPYHARFSTIMHHAPCNCKFANEKQS